MSAKDVILKMTGICKTFPGVRALHNVDFTLRKGEVHALMGENGAGKSTLIKVLTGVETLDKGRINLDGNYITPKSPLHVQDLGISTVYQEVNLCPNLSVAENLFIGREPKKYGCVIDWNTVNKKAENALKRLDVEIDVSQTLDSYSVAIQQMVAIARAVDISAKVLILDEPTSSLAKNEVEKLFQIINKLKSEGMGIVFVTHFLDQVYEVSDRITVLRNGEFVGEYEVEKLPKVQLVGKMIGKEFDELVNFSKASSETVNSQKELFIKMDGVSTAVIQPLNLNVYKGEVLGLAGLLGSGRSEVARILFGADKTSGGDMYVKNNKQNFSLPLDAIKNSIAFCPENRKTEGIIGDLSVRENIILALQTKRGFFKYIPRKEQEEIADKYIELLSIKVSSPEQLVKNLSGGNQQKVILARWLVVQPDLLILDEPTRGIDVGTKTEIQKLVISLAEKGMSVLFISSELDEMIRCCSRMAVLKTGSKVAELTDDKIDEHNIMRIIAGGEASA